MSSHERVSTSTPIEVTTFLDREVIVHRTTLEELRLLHPGFDLDHPIGVLDSYVVPGIKNCVMTIKPVQED